MKHLLTACVAVSLLGQTSWAATRADSILAFTGNRQVKAVWTRDAWCDAGYRPIASHADGKHIQVMVYSTAETGGPRVLNPEGDVAYPFITRKDGGQVVWTDRTSKCAWIRDFNCSAAKRNLNLGTDYEVLTVDYNAATGAENMYVRSSDQKTIYRVPFTNDYAADLTKKTSVITGSVVVDESFSVSGDGIMAGAALPWPTTYIYNMVSKQSYMRHTGQFGCNCNIAPDNSYRFYHFGDDHDLIHMFGPNLSTSFTDIPTTETPGNTAKLGQQQPRWTSNVNFMTVNTPIHADDPDAWTFENNAIFGWSASKVQQCPAYMFGIFCLGKFSADFKSVTWTLIAGGDRRNIEGDKGGMAWVAQNPGSVDVETRDRRQANAMTSFVTVHGGLVEAAFPAAMVGSLSIVNTAGRVVARASGAGRAACAIGSGLKGALIARVTTGAEVYSTRVIVR